MAAQATRLRCHNLQQADHVGVLQRREDLDLAARLAQRSTSVRNAQSPLRSRSQRSADSAPQRQRSEAPTLHKQLTQPLRRTVMGKPSFSLSIRIFFKATTSPVSLQRAENTSPYCP
jgi:hypothetical protein